MTTKRFSTQTVFVYTLIVLTTILEIHKIPGTKDHPLNANYFLNLFEIKLYGRSIT